MPGGGDQRECAAAFLSQSLPFAASPRCGLLFFFFLSTFRWLTKLRLQYTSSCFRRCYDSARSGGIDAAKMSATWDAAFEEVEPAKGGCPAIAVVAGERGDQARMLKNDDADSVPIQCTAMAERPNWPTYHFANNITAGTPGQGPGRPLMGPLNDANAIFEWKGMFHIMLQQGGGATLPLPCVSAFSLPCREFFICLFTTFRWLVPRDLERWRHMGERMVINFHCLSLWFHCLSVPDTVTVLLSFPSAMLSIAGPVTPKPMPPLVMAQRASQTLATARHR